MDGGRFLCVHGQNIFYADSVRPGDASSSLAAPSDLQTRTQHWMGFAQASDSPKAQAFPPHANQVCIYCKKAGHVQRKYLKCLKASRSTQPTSGQPPASCRLETTRRVRANYSVAGRILGNDITPTTD